MQLPTWDLKQLALPRSGLSEVTGIVADTIFKKTVRLRRIVTPGRKGLVFEIILAFDCFVRFS